MLDVESIIRVIEERGYTCSSVEKALSFGNGAIRRWSKNSPSIDKLFKLSNFLNIDVGSLLTGTKTKENLIDSRTPYENHVLKNFRNMDKEKQQYLIGISSVLLGEYSSSDRKTALTAKPSYSEEFATIGVPDLKIVNETGIGVADILHSQPSEEPEEELVSKIVIYQRVAAGSGNIFDGNFSYEIVSRPASEIPVHADFGMIISGDSMEPEIIDGDIVWVEKRIQLDNGQIGIFVLNGEAFCKEFRLEPDKNRAYLMSLNSKYKPIQIEKDDEFDIIGKVLL